MVTGSWKKRFGRLQTAYAPLGSGQKRARGGCPSSSASPPKLKPSFSYMTFDMTQAHPQPPESQHSTGHWICSGHPTPEQSLVVLKPHASATPSKGAPLNPTRVKPNISGDLPCDKPCHSPYLTLAQPSPPPLRRQDIKKRQDIGDPIPRTTMFEIVNELGPSQSEVHFLRPSSAPAHLFARCKLGPRSCTQNPPLQISGLCPKPAPPPLQISLSLGITECGAHRAGMGRTPRGSNSTCAQTDNSPQSPTKNAFPQWLVDNFHLEN